MDGLWADESDTTSNMYSTDESSCPSTPDDFFLLDFMPDDNDREEDSSLTQGMEDLLNSVSDLPVENVDNDLGDLVDSLCDPSNSTSTYKKMRSKIPVVELNRNKSNSYVHSGSAPRIVCHSFPSQPRPSLTTRDGVRVVVSTNNMQHSDICKSGHPGHPQQVNTVSSSNINKSISVQRNQNQVVTQLPELSKREQKAARNREAAGRHRQKRKNVEAERQIMVVQLTAKVAELEKKLVARDAENAALKEQNRFLQSLVSGGSSIPIASPVLDSDHNGISYQDESSKKRKLGGVGSQGMLLLAVVCCVCFITPWGSTDYAERASGRSLSEWHDTVIEERGEQIEFGLHMLPTVGAVPGGQHVASRILEGILTNICSVTVAFVMWMAIKYSIRSDILPLTTRDAQVSSRFITPLASFESKKTH